MLSARHRRIPATALLAAGALLLAGPAAAAPAAAAPARPTPAEGPIVRLDSGLIRGVHTESTQTYSGIRYAQPPVEELRWTDPRPVEPWPGIADATAPGNECPQQAPATGSSAEDCLFVNVTVPDVTVPHGDGLPVMVWLHGGGYTHDSGALYDARRMAAQGNVIVVTVNYRLGVFGYFGYPGLAGSGTFGLADQIAALRWTQRNAAAFGGDTGNVTVFGESAGAMSTCALLTSPAATGLFDKAIMSSGSCLIDWPAGTLYPGAPAMTPYTSVRITAADGMKLARQQDCGTGANGLECLRGKSVADLLPATQDFSNHLSYHSRLLPLQPRLALALGAFHRVPVLSGGNHDEQRSFIAGAIQQNPIDAQRYGELLKASFGGRAPAVAARYPLADYPSPAVAWSTVTTDRTWSCPTLAGDRLLARHTPVYAYDFADPNAPNLTPFELPGVPGSPETIGAAHATDLPYLFDLGGIPLPLAPEQQQLAAQMVDYWTTFAHTGDPNSAGSPTWPRFTGPDSVQRLAPGDTGPADYRAEHQCGFWSAIG